MTRKDYRISNEDYIMLRREYFSKPNSNDIRVREDIIARCQDVINAEMNKYEQAKTS